jgi:exopolysaccharide production protein ExoZ
VKGSRQRLDGIQFGRGVAAILVVLYHANRMMHQYVGQSDIGAVFVFGNAGVDFFFVLSGFIIFYVHGDDIDRPERLGRYSWRRVTRIYPIYWVVTAFLIAEALAKGDWAQLDPWHVAASLTLMPASQDPILDVGWTLCHEVLFYAAFALAIVSRRAGVIAAIVGLALVLAGLVDPPGNAIMKLLESPYHVEFAFGIAAAYAARRWPLTAAPGFVAAGLVSFVIVAAFFNALSADSALSGRLLYGASSAAIIYGIAVWEAAGRIRIPAWAAFLGAASYSIYLIHTIPIGSLGRAIMWLDPGATHPDFYYLVDVICAVTAGCALYWFIERPLQAVTRHLRPAKAVSSPAE